MQQKQIEYQDVIDLGFERKDSSDPVFFKQYGYKWFIVTKELSRRHFVHKGKGNIEVIYADWDCITRKVEIIRSENNEGDILGRIPIKSLAELKKAIEFYSN